MKHLLFLVIAICIGLFSASGQDFRKPDYDAIEKAIKDKSSDYYYPALLKRYQANDTTLTRDGYSHLYYGYFFKEEKFSFKKDNKTDETLRELLKNEKLTEQDKKKILSLSLLYLENNPFDLKKMNIVYRVYRDMGDTVSAQPYFKKIRSLIGVVLSSGDGKTDETGYHVLDVGHEYFILSVLGYESTSQTLTKHPCDYLALEKNDDNVEGIYFDVTQIFVGYKKMLMGK